MTLWFLFALMTAMAIFAILWPLARSKGMLRSGSDLAVYRDQLDEIARDRAAGESGGGGAGGRQVRGVAPADRGGGRTGRSARTAADRDRPLASAPGRRHRARGAAP